MNIDIDYYEVLDLEFNFTSEELKKSYREKSKKNHPDKGGNPEYFKIIAESHKILKDEDKRKKYDKMSEFGKDYSTKNTLSDYLYSNPNIFDKSYQTYLDKFKKELIHIIVKLPTFTNKIRYDKLILCDNCSGSGKSDDSNLSDKLGGELECDLCNTTGLYNKRECPSCLGDGYIKLALDKCKKCDGRGLVSVKRELKLKKSDFNDNKICYIGFGNYCLKSHKYGNLYIIIDEKE